MPTFPKGHYTHRLRLANAQAIARLSRNTDTPTIHITSSFAFPDPVDLRGIPALAHGVGGTMAGTQPERAATR